MTETATTPRSHRETLADVHVVDADVHIHEDPAALARLDQAHVVRKAVLELADADGAHVSM